MKTLYVDSLAFKGWEKTVVIQHLQEYQATDVVYLDNDLTGHLLGLSGDPPPGRLLTSVPRKHLWESIKNVEIAPWGGRPFMGKLDLRRQLLVWLGVPKERTAGLLKNWDTPEKSKKYKSVLEQAKLLLELPPMIYTEKKLFEDRDYQQVDDMAPEELTRVLAGELLAIDLETTGLDPLSDSIVGVSYSLDKGSGRWVPCGNNIPPILRTALEFGQIVTHNGKFDMKFLAVHGVDLKVLEDTQLVGYLLGTSPSLSLKNMTEQHLHIPVIRYKEVTSSTFNLVDEDIARAYACQDADITLGLHARLHPELDNHLLNIYHSVEVPLIPILARMELLGMPVNLAKAQVLADQLAQEIDLAYFAMEAMVGSFNPSSNRELEAILFDRLGLDPLFETKTGYKTDVWTLRQYEDNPFVALLLIYKEKDKLLNTYLRPLLAKGVSRVHANFNQTTTETGRLSSSGPNLQNQAPYVRQIYEAPPGYVLIAADYSQQELRLLAHVSQDPVLLDAYRTGKDLHAETAAKLGVPRRLAKNVNFGIPYGAGPDAIAKQGRCSKQEARKMLDSHRREFPTLWEYIEETKQRARRQGYSLSILGRKRLLPNINGYGELQQAAEREAVNMVIQGSAADMTKMAMIALQQVLPPDVNMITQVHDEIIFEAKDTFDTGILDVIRSTMESVMPLSVPVEASIKVGKSWDLLK